MRTSSIDTSQIALLINDLKQAQVKDSVTPEYLGSILERLAGLIEQAGLAVMPSSLAQDLADCLRALPIAPINDSLMIVAANEGNAPVAVKIGKIIAALQTAQADLIQAIDNEEMVRAQADSSLQYGLDAATANAQAALTEAENASQALSLIAEAFDMEERENALRLRPEQLITLVDYGLHVEVLPGGRGLKAWHSQPGVESEFCFPLSLEAGERYTLDFIAENFSYASKITIASTQGTYFGSNFREEDGRIRNYLSQGSNSSGTAYISVKLHAQKALSEADAFVITDGRLCKGDTCEPTCALAERALPERLKEHDNEAQAKPKYTTLAATAVSVGKRISATLGVGDEMEMATAQWRGLASFAVPHGAKGAWVCGSHDHNYPRWAVVDSAGKVLKIAAKDPASSNDNRGYYIGMGELTAPAKVVVEVVPNADSATAYWDYGEESDMIYEGEKIEATMSDNAEETGREANGMRVRKARLTASRPSVTWTLRKTARGRSVSVWLRMPNFGDVERMPYFFTSLSKGGQPVGVTEKESSQVLQMGEWVELKIRTTDMDADKVTVRAEFAAGATEAVLEVGDSVVSGRFERPAIVIDFDQSWAATDACGAYDALIANKVPFTITGSISAAEEKLRGAYLDGLLDAGSYGGPTNGAAITGYTTMAENMAALYGRFDAQTAQGFGVPTSYGGGGHVVTPLAAKALRLAGYTCVKGGVLGGLNLAKSAEDWILYIGGSADTAMTLGGTYAYFAHGISADPTEETNPTLYYTAASFMAMLEEALAHRASGGCRLLNMRQWAEQSRE